MVKKQIQPSVLPHLPKGMGMPQTKRVDSSHEVLLPGQKTLPSADWKNSDAQQQQLVPGIQHGGGQQMVRQQSTISKQGIPWTDRQSKVQIDARNEPPPMFTAAPRKNLTFSSFKENKTQKQVYRMESGIDPVDLLTSRLESWRLAIKNLVGLFKKIAENETRTAKGLVNASKEIHLPFRKANGQFLESGGIQDVWSAIRDYTMQHGMMHNEAVNYLQSAVIPSLRAIKADIKQMIVQIEKDKSLKSSSIFESRMQVDKLITRLDRVIESTRRAPQFADANTDPFLVNLGVIHAIRELCDHENRLHDNVLNLQKETGIFEQSMVESLRKTLRALQDFRVKNKLESEDYIGTVNATFENIQPYTEWNSFVHRNQFNLVMENSGYKTESMVEYPNQDSEYVRAVKIGPLQLKTGITRGWTEGVYLLTPAGFLHGYKTPKHFQTSPLRPNYSIFIPNTSIEADEDNFETFGIRQQSNKKVSLGGSHYIFRAPTQAENQSWFEALVRIADQFRVIPLLDTTEHGFSSTAPIQRDLPPLPSSILPIEGGGGGGARGAIENQPHQEVPQQQVLQQQVPQQQQGLDAVHEDVEDEEGEGSTTPKQLTHSAQVVPSPNVVTNDDGSSIDNWQSVHDDAGDFDETGSKTVDDEEHDLALAQQHLQDTTTPATGDDSHLYNSTTTPTAAGASAAAANNDHLYSTTAPTATTSAAVDDSHLYRAEGSSKQASEPAL